MYWRPRLESSRPKTVVCPQCNNVKDYDSNQKCSCGGLFVDIRQMKWVTPNDHLSGA